MNAHHGAGGGGGGGGDHGFFNLRFNPLFKPVSSCRDMPVHTYDRPWDRELLEPLRLIQEKRPDDYADLKKGIFELPTPQHCHSVLI